MQSHQHRSLLYQKCIIHLDAHFLNLSYAFLKFIQTGDDASLVYERQQYCTFLDFKQCLRNVLIVLFSCSSTVTALFDQIEKEILNSEDFQATFELVHELHTACEKDVLVKKLFWQVQISILLYSRLQMPCEGSV